MSAVGSEVGSVVPLAVGFVLLFAVPLFTYLYEKTVKRRTVKAYISGVNRQGGRAFQSAYGDDRHLELSNFYMEEYFGEKKLLTPSIMVGAALLAASFVVQIILIFVG